MLSWARPGQAPFIVQCLFSVFVCFCFLNQRKVQERHREEHTLTPTDTRHQGGMVRVHPPLWSQSKQLPRVITVDIRPNNNKNKITRNILKYNFLFFTMTSRCWNRTPKAILPAEGKKKKQSCLFGILWFRPAGGDLLQYGCYNSEVRRKQLQAIT